MYEVVPTQEKSIKRSFTLQNSDIKIMNRYNEIAKAASESMTETLMSTPNYEFSPRATDLLECAYIKGAEWADEHPKSPWHSVADGDLPQNNTYCFFSIGINEIEIGHVMDGCVHFNSTEKPWMLKDMDYWMEIPKLPKERRWKMKEEFIYHNAEDYTLIMTSSGEGICSVSIDENIRSCACIYNLSVEEKYRKKGYGNRLLKEAESVAQMLGASIVSLAAKKGSFMPEWYQRRGYKPVFSDSEFVTLYKEL